MKTTARWTIINTYVFNDSSAFFNRNDGYEKTYPCFILHPINEVNNVWIYFCSLAGYYYTFFGGKEGGGLYIRFKSKISPSMILMWKSNRQTIKYFARS